MEMMMMIMGKIANCRPVASPPAKEHFVTRKECVKNLFLP